MLKDAQNKYIQFLLKREDPPNSSRSISVQNCERFHDISVSLQRDNKEGYEVRARAHSATRLFGVSPH